MPNFFASSGNEILTTSVGEPKGWLSNMSPHPIVYEGVRWRTSEALFQAMRLEDAKAREEIRLAYSPMIAKNIAKGHRGLRVVDAMSPNDLDNMRVCISLKLAQHEELRRRLFFTGNSKIIEDCSLRAERGNNWFWGAVRRVRDDREGWEGDNWLGRIWEEMRTPLQIIMAAEWGDTM